MKLYRIDFYLIVFTNLCSLQNLIVFSSYTGVCVSFPYYLHRSVDAVVMSKWMKCSGYEQMAEVQWL